MLKRVRILGAVKKMLSSIIDIRKGEIGLTLLMVANYYLILVTYYFLKPARDSLFLVRVSSEQLPLVFIVTALVTAPIVTLYTKASRSFKLNQLIALTQIVLIVCLFGLRWLVRLDDDWVYYLFYTWVSIYGALTTSQFWLLANAVYHPAQAKRLFVLLGLSGIIGAFTGGEVTNIVVSSFGVATEDLLLFCAGLLLICIALTQVIWRIHPEEVAIKRRRSRIEKQPKESMTESFRVVARSRHLLLIVGMVAMTMMVASFVDYQFKTVSSQAFPTKDELTGFLGTFYGRLSLVSLVLQLLFTYRFLRIVGVGGVILFLPLGLLTASSLMFIMPGLAAAVLLRGTDGSLKYSIDKTGRELLFLPVPLDVKKKTKIFIDLFVDRWFRGLAGGLLLLCTMVLGLSVRQISLVVIGLIGIWLLLAFMMRKEYVNTFRRALERREIDLSEIRTTVNEQSTVNTLIVALASENDRQVVYALDMLKGVKEVDLTHPVIPLLEHPSAEVRTKAIEVLHSQEAGSLLSQVKGMLEDPALEVRREALHYLYLHTEGEHSGFWNVHLHHPDYAVRCAALDALSRYGSQDEKRLVTDDVLDDLMQSPADGQSRGRLLVAGALGYLKRPQQQRYLKRLLHDNEPEVVKQAITSVGRLKDREYVPWLINKLADARYRVTIRGALAQYGRSILGTMTDYLFDEQVPLSVRRNIPRVMAEIPLQLSVDTLSDALDKVEPNLKYYVLKGLNRLRIHHSELKFPTRRVDQALIAETKVYYEILSIITATKPAMNDEASRLLERALTEKQEQNLELIFRLLGLSYPPRDIYSAYQGIVSQRQALRASAIEFLDNLLRNNIKKYLFPILDEVSPDMRLQKGEELFGIRYSDREEALLHLIEGRDPWLRACACFCAGRMGSESLRPALEKALDDRDPVVREAAEWTIRRGAAPGA